MTQKEKKSVFQYGDEFSRCHLTSPDISYMFQMIGNIIIVLLKWLRLCHYISSPKPLTEIRLNLTNGFYIKMYLEHL